MSHETEHIHKLRESLRELIDWIEPIVPIVRMMGGSSDLIERITAAKTVLKEMDTGKATDPGGPEGRGRVFRVGDAVCLTEDFAGIDKGACGTIESVTCLLDPQSVYVRFQCKEHACSWTTLACVFASMLQLVVPAESTPQQPYPVFRVGGLVRVALTPHDNTDIPIGTIGRIELISESSAGRWAMLVSLDGVDSKNVDTWIDCDCLEPAPSPQQPPKLTMGEMGGLG